MGQIYIEWTWVGSFGIDSPYRHMYLVYKPAPDAPIKESQVIRAGPESDVTFGDMIADRGTLLQESRDRYSEGETPEDRGSRLLYDGADASALWSQMVDVAIDIPGGNAVCSLGPYAMVPLPTRVTSMRNG